MRLETKKKIGGSGFLGQHLIKLIQEQDQSVKEIRTVDLVPYTNKLSKFIFLVFNESFRNKRQ